MRLVRYWLNFLTSQPNSIPTPTSHFHYPTMTDHKTTPEQWAAPLHGDPVASIAELRARVALLEATQHVHIETVQPAVKDSSTAGPAPAGSFALPGPSLGEFVSAVRRIQSAVAPIVELHTQIETARAGQALPAPAGSLVERVTAAPNAHGAIREVAAWLDAQGVGAGRAAARWLEQEAERG